MKANWNEVLSVFVPGIPKPGGSKVAGVVFNRAGEIVKTKTGRPLVTVRDAGGEPTRHWRAAVADFVGRAWGNRALLDEPMFVKFIFYFPRPASHFGSGRNAGVLRDSAPPFPAVAPDCTKLVRSAEDSLTGVLYRDDSRIVRQAVGKFYGERAGCLVKVLTLSASSSDDAEIDAAVTQQVQSDQCGTDDKPHTAPGDRPGSATRGAAVERHKRALSESIDKALSAAGVEACEQARCRLLAYLAGAGAPERAFASADLQTLVEWDQRVRGLRSAAVREIASER